MLWSGVSRGTSTKGRRSFKQTSPARSNRLGVIPLSQRGDAVHAGRCQHHSGGGVGAAGNGGPQVVDGVMFEEWVFLPFDQRFVEIAPHFFLPYQTSGVGAHDRSRYVPRKEGVHRSAGHDRATGAGDADDYRVTRYSVTARMVKTSSTIEIVLLYWNNGDRSLDRSLALTKLFSKTSMTVAIPQPMK